MSMTDPIADMLTRIRNAHQNGVASVSMPASKLKAAIAGVLQDEGYIAGCSIEQEGGKRVEVKPATPKGSGSLARPSGSSSAPPRPGGGGSSGGRSGMGLPPFGGAPGVVAGSPGALFGSPTSPYAAGYGMFGYPHAGKRCRGGHCSRARLHCSCCAALCHACMNASKRQIPVAEHEVVI